MSTETLLRTPLHGKHLEAGARMVPFAGYEMPVQYDSVISEGKTVREGAGMFDVSHMARLSFTGERVVEFLEWVTVNDVSKLENRTGQYSMLPNENGGVVDDIIVYRTDDLLTGPWAPDSGSGENFRMVVNGSNHQKDVEWLRSQNSFEVEITDQTRETAMVAVQGPAAVDTLAKMSADAQELRSALQFGVVLTTIGGVECFAARSGYTGEDGFELICSASDAPQLWQSLLEAGVKPCGLASRDALRVEAGLPLYGHELTDELSPISAGLGWVISKNKSFIGSEHINKAREEGTPQKLQGVQLESKRVAAPGMKVFVGGREVGEVSSGVYSPLLDRGIAFAFVDRDIALDTACEVDIRGKMEPARVVNKRFFKRSKG